jgi:G3E family GTPase
MTFSFPTPDGTISLMDISRLDTMVTVIDASAWLEDVKQGPRLAALGMAAGETDTRTVSDLLIDQVEFANVIVINKIDLVSEAELGRVEETLRKLNPTARMMRAQEGRVSLREVLNTNLFDMDTAQRSAGWLKELEGEHTPETEEYGISSFVFKARRPFHPVRVMDFIKSDLMKSVLRSKGFMWLASRHDVGVNWSLSGHVARVAPAGYWLASVPAAQRSQDPTTLDYIAQYWQEPFGDRRQELVFIGIDMPKDEMLSRLKAALLTDEEMALIPDQWAAFPDPFPIWQANGATA